MAITLRRSMTRPPRLGSLRVRLELVTFAFAPAFALMAIRTWGASGWAGLCPWISAGFATLGILYGVVLAFLVLRDQPHDMHFNNISDAGEEVLGHIGSYLLPVVVSPDGGTSEILIAFISFILIVFIHAATGRVHVNPLAYLVGYRIYTATTAQTEYVAAATYYLFVRSDPAEWRDQHRSSVVDIGPTVRVERREGGNTGG